MAGVYDVCVVGAGMVGSAAARHLSALQDKTRKVLLIGPDEPQDRSTTDIFGAWHDEGRITRILDPDYVWCHLAEKSIDRYRRLEEDSGISFYSEVGYLILGPHGNKYNEDTIQSAKKLNLATEYLNGNSVKSRFPYFNLPHNFEGVFSESRSGHISPRNLVKALKTVAIGNGCDVRSDIVHDVKMAGEVVEIQTDSGRVYHSKRVLMATGAFTSCRKLLPDYLQPDVRLQSGTVILVRLKEQEARKLKSMPAYFIIRSEKRNTDELGRFNVYGLPPILYPDGHYYMKMGHGKTDDVIYLDTPAAIRTWYQGNGDPELIRKTIDIFHEYFPDIQYDAILPDRCIVAVSPTRRPYIDMLTPNIGVALAGNGNAAKCCDELGKIAASMIVNGKWSYSELPGDIFRYRAKQSGQD